MTTRIFFSIANLIHLFIFSLLLLPLCLAHAQQSNEELAKAAQNPIADMISLPFQNNTNYNVGPKNQTQNILNIQPVVPFDLNRDWNVVTDAKGETVKLSISQGAFGVS